MSGVRSSTPDGCLLAKSSSVVGSRLGLERCLRSDVMPRGGETGSPRRVGAGIAPGGGGSWKVGAATRLAFQTQTNPNGSKHVQTNPNKWKDRRRETLTWASQVTLGRQRCPACRARVALLGSLHARRPHDGCWQPELQRHIMNRQPAANHLNSANVHTSLNDGVCPCRALRVALITCSGKTRA